MEQGELIFIETTGEDAPSTLMLVVSQKREEGFALFGGMVAAHESDQLDQEGRVEYAGMSKLGQWLEQRGFVWAVPEYKLARASMAHLLEEAVHALIQEGWRMYEPTIFHQGKYLQWMYRWPQGKDTPPGAAVEFGPVVVSLDA